MPPDRAERRPDEGPALNKDHGEEVETSISDPADNTADLTAADIYPTTAVRRSRRTKAEVGRLHEAILTVCEVDHPLSVRGVFYRVMSAGAVDKTEKAYNAVQRVVLKLRRSGDLPYEWIADGTRWHLKLATARGWSA